VTIVSRAEPAEAGRVRLDKWLWASRFFKTRTLAGEAVDGGKVHLNGERVKAGRAVKPGDRLEIRRGPEVFEVLVLALSEHRGPAAAAQALYEESEAGRARREALSEQRRLFAAGLPLSSGRPDKRSRRQIIRFRDGDASDQV
jgi:ribosome-associated heat shock protein Hsp15